MKKYMHQILLFTMLAMTVGRVGAQTMVGGTLPLALDTTTGDLSVDPGWHKDSSIAIRLSTVWDGAESGTLLINGIERTTLGANEDRDFLLTLPANSSGTYACEFTSGTRVYQRTLNTTGARKQASSAIVPLDTRTGIRETDENGESLLYDIAWNAGAVRAQIEDNGSALVSGTKGSCLWGPDSYPTLHTLSLKMVNGAGRVLSTETAQFTSDLTYQYEIVYSGLHGAANPNPTTYTIEDAVTFATLADFGAVPWDDIHAAIRIVREKIASGAVKKMAPKVLSKPDFTFRGLLKKAFS